MDIPTTPIAFFFALLFLYWQMNGDGLDRNRSWHSTYNNSFSSQEILKETVICKLGRSQYPGLLTDRLPAYGVVEEGRDAVIRWRTRHRNHLSASPVGL